MKAVAIAVPLSTRQELTPDEVISLRHLVHFLGKYDKYAIAPKHLTVSLPGFGIKRYPDRFFGSLAAHNRLLLSPRFYDVFQEYKYLLIYHLDALVFSDQLQQWCETDLDYIGAPWLTCEDTPWVKVPKVGNGGFSLRKIDSFLKVIESPRYTIDPATYWREFCASNPKYRQYLHLPKKYLKRLRVFNGARWQMSHWHGLNGENEDCFWSDKGTNYYPGFKIASVEVGLRFAFEAAPRWCFELNGRRLPFGCHAWPRYDRDFWEPYLLR